METGRKFELEWYVGSASGNITRMDVFKGQHFNVRIICLDSGTAILPRNEPYEVFFYVLSGKGSVSAGGSAWDVGPGSMVYAPEGPRGIKCTERLTILGVQGPH